MKNLLRVKIFLRYKVSHPKYVAQVRTKQPHKVFDTKCGRFRLFFIFLIVKFINIKSGKLHLNPSYSKKSWNCVTELGFSGPVIFFKRSTIPFSITHLAWVLVWQMSYPLQCHGHWWLVQVIFLPDFLAKRNFDSFILSLVFATPIHRYHQKRSTWYNSYIS